MQASVGAWSAHGSTGRALQLYQRMAIIREFEEAAHAALQQGKVFGPVHQSIGQEAVAVGVCANLRPSDLIESNHRGHGHAIAKGADPVAMMKELFARRGGTNGGKGGSMHIADFSVGMLGANGILADGVTLGVGAAHAAKLKGDDTVVGVFVGDGTTNRGPFYEGLNWAKVYDLPLLIVCENNAYASSTVTAKVTAGQGPAARARAFDIVTEEVDGNDVLAVDAAARRLVDEIRSGGGPRFLHAITYRIKGHISKDMLRYRPPGETETRLPDEPLRRARSFLLANGADPAAVSAAESDARALIARALSEAEAAPFPDPAEAYTDVQDNWGQHGQA